LKRNGNGAVSETRQDPSEGAGLGKIRAETDSTKLRDFLNNLEDGED